MTNALNDFRHLTIISFPICYVFSVLDSTAKFPDGALDFHIQLLGNMEECIDIDVPSQVFGDETLPGFTGKYLYSKFGRKKSNSIFNLKIGELVKHLK